MSDPSSNLNNYVREFRNRKDVKKSHSESEGVDFYGNGINEIEAGDIRDGMLIYLYYYFSVLRCILGIN